MAYINQELALELLKRNSITEHITFSDGVSIYDTIANIPAADVVPKSEVERLLEERELKYSQALQDKARECNMAVDKICLAHREEIRSLQKSHEAQLAAVREKLEKLNKDRYQILPDGRIELLPRTDIDAIKTEVAREIFAGVKLRLQNMADKYGYKATLEPDFDQKKEYRGAQIGVSVALHSVVAYEYEVKKKYTEGE